MKSGIYHPCRARLSLTSRFKLTFCSAVLIAKARAKAKAMAGLDLARDRMGLIC